MSIRPLLAVPLLLACASLVDAQPRLTERSYDRLRDFLLPNAEEEAWRKIAWKPTFWDAVCEAQKEEKPILLWAMNGHPLGHT